MMRILELTLQSRNIVAQRVFYHDSLRLPLLEEGSQHITIQTGHTRITFEQAKTALPNSVYHFAFNVPQNQLMQAKDWLTARTSLAVAPDDPQIYDFVDWNAHAFYFLDGDSNIVEFIARHNLDNAANEPFSEHSIIGVSEIGLATPDVIQTVKFIQHNLGIGVWRGEGSDMFSALGDEHGLFIVVKSGRKWLSSDRAALPLPTDLTIAGMPDHTCDVPGLPIRIRRSTRTTAPR